MTKNSQNFPNIKIFFGYCQIQLRGELSLASSYRYLIISLYFPMVIDSSFEIINTSSSAFFTNIEFRGKCLKMWPLFVYTFIVPFLVSNTYLPLSRTNLNPYLSSIVCTFDSAKTIPLLTKTNIPTRINMTIIFIFFISPIYT